MRFSRPLHRSLLAAATLASSVALLAGAVVPTGAALAADAAARVASPVRPLGVEFDAPPLDSPTVTVAGTPAVGAELTADADSWPEGVAFTYQWLVAGVAVDGAIDAVYTPRADDRGKTVQVTVTGSGPDFGPVTATSDPSALVDYGTLTASGRPVISGVVQVGNQVTASVVSWSPHALTPYTWLVDGTSVGAGRAYTIQPKDAGKVLTVVVSGLEPGYRITSVRSDPVTIAYGRLTAPAPTISGSVRLDDILTAHPGQWPTGTYLRYQWAVDGVAVVGATGTAYTVRHADADKTITVAVTGSKRGFDPLTAVSAPTPPVAYGTLSAPRPTLTGDARVGSVLKARVGAWTPGAQLTYQWLLDGRPVAGATGTTLTMQPAYRGKRVSFAVTGSLTGHKTSRVVSVASRAVSPGVLVSPAPGIRGTAKHGVTLTAKPGTWSPGTALSYAWYVGGKPVVGATSARYTPTRVDLGKVVAVKVTGRKAGYTTTVKTSAATKPVAKKSVFRLATPDITGVPKVGRKLLVSTTVWVPEIRYQWYVGGHAVRGATGDTFAPRASDRGKTVSCTVTIRKAGYVSVTKTSERTAPVR